MCVPIFQALLKEVESRGGTLPDLELEEEDEAPVHHCTQQEPLVKLSDSSEFITFT